MSEGRLDGHARDGVTTRSRRGSLAEQRAAELRAARLGERLAELIDDPEAFLAALSTGIPPLGDDEHRALTRRTSPGVDASFALRGPLRTAILRPVGRALRLGSAASALYLAQRLATCGQRDLRLYALPCLRRSLPDDPERSWQLLRRMASRAEDWIEVDSLAGLWAEGILAESFRWAELEQLAYSPRVCERRLVGASVATLPHRLPGSRHHELRDGLSQRSLELVALLMGDSEEMVRKALSWALREWARRDPRAVADLLESETESAVRDGDGARAWVIRDSLSALPPRLATTLRGRLTGLRRDASAPSTSLAARRAAAFSALIDIQDGVARQGDRSTRIQA
jgi:3-methyladenine DNA glycosylase AlkD